MRCPSRFLGVPLIVVAFVLAGCTPEGGRAPEAESPPDSVSDSSLQELREEQLAETAQAFGIEDPPQVEVVRFIAPEEREAVQAACMTDQGFAPDDEGLFNAPNDQAEAMHLALYRCTAMYPLDDKYLTPLQTDQLEIVHAHYTETLVPCLRAEGATVEEPPTLQTFVATVGTDQEYSPYTSATSGMLQSEVDRLLERCPPLPPTDVLYGQ